MAADQFTAIPEFYDEVMARIPYEGWTDYIEALVDRWGGSLHRVLDVACGTGSVSLEFSRRGAARVLGVDRSVGMLRVARRKAAESGLGARFVQQDMRALSLAPAFDTVVCLFDSLNYLLELSDVKAALRGMAQAVLDDGLVIFDVNTVLALEQELFTQEDMDENSPVRLRWRSAYDRRSRTTRVDMEFFLPDGTVVREVHHERAYTGPELRHALSAAGLRTMAVYDAYTFKVPRRDSDRLFYVCRKG